MTWNPGPTRFWEGLYEHPKEIFDPKDERRRQAQYLLQHPEIQSLASLFVAHMCRQGILAQRNVLKSAGYFFTRPADVLRAEVDDLLQRNDMAGPKEELRKEGFSGNPPPVYVRPSSDCLCPSVYSTSVGSVYSSFISQSTSASTISSAAPTEVLTPTLDESLWEMVIKAFNNSLNIMYAARDHVILYDEGYLCLTRVLQRAVETVWVPRLQEIQGVIDGMLDDVMKITTEKRRLKLLMTDKLPSKVNRLKNNFKGYTEYDYPALKKNEIRETIRSRQGAFNRYPKDRFGVYLPSGDKSLESTTYVPEGCGLEGDNPVTFGDDPDVTMEDLTLEEEED